MKRLAGNKGSVDVKVRHRLRATGLQCPLRTPRNLCHWGSQQGCYHSPQLLQWGSPVNPTVFINVDSTEDSYHLSHWGNQQPLQLQTLEREMLTPPPDPSPRERAHSWTSLGPGLTPHSSPPLAVDLGANLTWNTGSEAILLVSALKILAA